MKEKISITIDAQVLKEIDRLVDHITIKNRSHAIEYLARKSVGKRRVAVILCGGPSEMLRIKDSFRPSVMLNGKALIEHTLEKLSENHFKEVFIVARKKVLSAVFDVIRSGETYGVNVNYVEEEKSLGTAASLRLVKGKINRPFLMVYGDVYINQMRIEELWQSHIKNNAIATLILTSSSTPTQKGVVQLEGSKILSFKQKPTHSNIYIGFSSMLIGGPELLDYDGNWLELDVFPRLAKEGKLGGHVSSIEEFHIHTEKDRVESEKLLDEP